MASSTGAESGGTPPDPIVIHHAPMSERQQLALIKRLEKANAQSQSNSDASILVSPPRAPLQVVHDANGANINVTNSSTSSSTAESPASTPSTGGTTPSSTTLRRAIFSQQNNSPTVERLLKKISKKNTKGETPLHTAAIRGSARLVRQLLQMGADPNAQDNAEWSPLHEACNRGNLSVVKVLHEFGADLNLKGFGKDSPLHDAARNGHLKVVKFLIRSGANLNAKNASGRTPREESELTLLRVNDNEDLNKTVSFLIELEGDAISANAGNISDISTDSDSDGEAENSDLAKFLGVSKSPVVQQALQIMGITPIRTSLRKTPQKQNNETPTSARSKPFCGNAQNGANCSTKVRLTYGTSDTTNKNNEDIDDEDGCSSIKKLKMSPPDEKTNKKVPPLKIVLQKTKISTDPENEVSMSDVTSGDIDGEPSFSSSEINSIEQQKPQLPPQQPFVSSEIPFEYYMKKRKLRTPAVAVVLPQQRGQREPLKEEVSNLDDEHYDERLDEVDEMSTAPQINSNDRTEHVLERRSATTSQEDSKEALNLIQTSSSTLPPVQETKKEVSEDILSEGNVASAEKRPKAKPKAASKVPLNDFQKYKKLRKQVELKQKNIFPVQPKPPQGYEDYLMNRKTYLLKSNAHERLRSVPLAQPPSSLKGPFRDLFIEQEEERFKLRTRHMVEKEKLILSVEQEILRVHGRAARCLANQTVPFSVCTILRDEEVYDPVRFKPLEQPDDKTKDVRSRYNGRLFISWLQDVDDKWERIKEQMVLRHHNEAESLHAFQKLNWEWKMDEISGNAKTDDGASIPDINDLHIPMVRVSDEFNTSV